MYEGNDNRDFEAESDGQSLLHAEEIKNDPTRFKKAFKHVQKTTKAHNKARRALETHAQSMKDNPQSQNDSQQADQENEETED